MESEVVGSRKPTALISLLAGITFWSVGEKPSFFSSSPRFKSRNVSSFHHSFLSKSSEKMTFLLHSAILNRGDVGYDTI